MATSVLFIGGTGCISSACVNLALQQGMDVFLLNRGESKQRPVPEGAQLLTGNIRDPASVSAALGKRRFDCVIDWVVFTADQIEIDIELFKERAAQYIFISSASAYRKPAGLMPITESTLLGNPYWQYSRDKIACEERLIAEWRANRFPFTIVRPSHTYDRTRFPWFGDWTVVDRMLQGKKVVVHGDGTSLWTITHAEDFAVGFNGLIGNDEAIGETFHITSDEALSWNRIHEVFAGILGLELKIEHVPSDLMVAYNPGWEGDLWGDRGSTALFDNSKIRRFVPDYLPKVPFSQGAREIIDWFRQEPARQIIDPKLDSLFDQLVSAQRSAYPGVTR